MSCDVALDADPGVLVGADFDALFRQEYARLLGMAFVLMGDARAADDLVQDAFVIAHARWRRVGAMDRPDLWVRRVVINLSRSRRRRLAAEARALLKLGGRLDDRQLCPEPDDGRVWAAVRGLPRRQAQVLVLVGVEGCTLAEAAEVLGIGPETAKTHLARARKRLTSELEEER